MARVHMCFWLEPTDRQRRNLRRFTFSSDKVCPDRNYGHDASARVEDGEQIYIYEDGRIYFGSPEVDEYRNDLRWPTQCEACGYVFQDDDEWQVNGHQIMISTTSLGPMTVFEAPAGAMWDITSWTSDKWNGSDGKSLAVKLPPGGPYDYWMIDGPSSNGGKWVRIGSILPNISVTPSILTDKYHGFLTNGQLIEC